MSASKSGVTVDDDLHQDLVNIVREHTPSIHEQFPEGSFKQNSMQRQAMGSGANEVAHHHD